MMLRPECTNSKQGFQGEYGVFFLKLVYFLRVFRSIAVAFGTFAA